MNKTKVIVIGAGGHARTVGSILKKQKHIDIVNFIDKTKKNENETIAGVDIIKVNSIIEYLSKSEVENIILAIGNNEKRREYFSKLKEKNYNFINAIHPSAIIEDSAQIGDGVVIGAGCIIGTDVLIGDNVIVNTGAIIDHESVIETNSHLGPGVKIAGRVKIGSCTFIGIGSTVIDQLIIGNNVIIGAGSVVIDNINSDSKIAGVPADMI